MLERLRQRLDLLSRGAEQQDAIRLRRDQVVCEYLAEYRKLCAHVGPYCYAADLGLPAGLDGPVEIRVIAYAAAWHDMTAGCDFIDEAIEAAGRGFEDWRQAELDAPDGRADVR